MKQIRSWWDRQTGLNIYMRAHPWGTRIMGIGLALLIVALVVGVMVESEFLCYLGFVLLLLGIVVGAVLNGKVRKDFRRSQGRTDDFSAQIRENMAKAQAMKNKQKED